MVKNFIFILLLFISTSCSNSPKEIPEEKLRDMVAEIVLADSYISNIMKPTYRGRDTIDYFNPILDKYGYTIKDLEYSLDKYARRKTDIIWNTLDQATARVDVIRTIYDNTNKMRENLNKIIAERSTDTIYYNKDTIKIKSASDLKKLIKEEHITNRGVFNVSYNYKIGENENNESRYFVYYLNDTLIKSKTPYRNSFWIAATNSTDEKRTSSRSIKIEDTRKYNKIKIIPFDYTNRSNTSKEEYKRMDSKIWDLLITFTPDPRDIETKVILQDNPYPFMIDAKSQYEERFDITLITPYTFKTLGINIEETIKVDSL